MKIALEVCFNRLLIRQVEVFRGLLFVGTEWFRLIRRVLNFDGGNVHHDSLRFLGNFVLLKLLSPILSSFGRGISRMKIRHNASSQVFLGLHWMGLTLHLF